MSDVIALGGYTKSGPGAVATGSFFETLNKVNHNKSNLNPENERSSPPTDPVAANPGSDFVSPSINFILTHSSFDTGSLVLTRKTVFEDHHRGFSIHASEMFIDRNAKSSSTPFGGAEVKREL